METIALSQPSKDEKIAAGIIVESSLPVYIYAVVFSSLSITMGLIWDLSWHMTIGRDGLFSPPHVFMYLGAVIAGAFSGYHVLRLTFASKPAEKQSAIHFWGIFYGSLGALFCIWGAFAMITSAPFDDWWHNTFGLDVKVLSPPHSILAVGMITIQFGAIVSVLAFQNRATDASAATRNIISQCFNLSFGFLLIIVFFFSNEYLTRDFMHKSLFYQIGGALFPLFMVAASRASAGKWGATGMATVFSVLLILLVWILPLFPAEPKLGPVLNHVTHYQNFDFPLLLIFPAIAIDLVNQHMREKPDFVKAIAIGILFTVIFLVFQWPFGDFLMSTYSRNWIFGSRSWYFGTDPDYPYRYTFKPSNLETTAVFIKGIGIAIVIAIVSTSVGFRWGRWMKSIKR